MKTLVLVAVTACSGASAPPPTSVTPPAAPPDAPPPDAPKPELTAEQRSAILAACPAVVRSCTGNTENPMKLCHEGGEDFARLWTCSESIYTRGTGCDPTGPRFGCTTVMRLHDVDFCYTLWVTNPGASLLASAKQTCERVNGTYHAP